MPWLERCNGYEGCVLRRFMKIFFKMLRKSIKRIQRFHVFEYYMMINMMISYKRVRS